MGDGLAAALAHRHFLPRMRMAVDRRIDGAARPVRHAPDEGEIAAPHRAGAAVVGELRGQRLMCARSFLATTISPVVSLSSRCTMPGRLTPPIPERLAPQWAISAFTKRAGLVAGGGMHHEASGLVDDDDVVVLIDDIERDILACGSAATGFRHVDCDRIARGRHDKRGRGRGCFLMRDLAGEDQRFQPRARQVRHGAPRARGRAGPIPRRRRR